MKVTLDEFCCLTSLRSGCYVIATFHIITATMYLIRFAYTDQLNSNGPHTQKGKEDGDFEEYAAIISFIGCAFGYITSVLLLIGVCKSLLRLIIVAAVLLFIYSGIAFVAAVFSALKNELAVCISLLIHMVLELYFTLVAYSYFIEARDERNFLATMDETAWATFQQERVQAKEQGFPDPMKAAVQKYRANLDEEEPSHETPETQGEEATSSKPRSS